ncbi:pectin lyase fold/virulence factor [Myxozyma melibiosi]|uniref:Pectin lyase fold/virulence factor n=1 Tax=Myxozyma melibiosi TaxID=54550 RepID=A0ABR1F457_9ASCO
MLLLLLLLSLSLSLPFIAARPLALLPRDNPSITATYSYPSAFSLSSFGLHVDDTPVPVFSYIDYDYAHYSNGAYNVTYTITVSSPDYIDSTDSISISPNSLAIDCSLSDDHYSFTFPLTGTNYIIVKIGSQRELVIFADPPELHNPYDDGSPVISVTDSSYNADANATSVSTDAFQRAIDDSAASGAVCYVPAGEYLVGTLILPSNTRFFVDEGAFVRSTANYDDYELDFEKGGYPIVHWIRTAIDSSNISIYGRGMFDARGADCLAAATPFKMIVIQPLSTTSFTYDGPMIRESGFWTMTPTMVKYGTIKNLKIINNLTTTENDGIDIMHSSDVTVEHALIISGDDAYSLKTWNPSTDVADSWPKTAGAGDGPGDDPLFTSDTNILITDTVAWTGCIGWKIGYGTYEPVVNSQVTHSTLYQGAIGFGVDSKQSSSSSVVQNITYESIAVEQIVEGHGLYYGGWMAIMTRQGNSGVANVKDITVKDITVKDLGGREAHILGYDEDATVSNVEITNVTFGDSSSAYSILSGILTWINNLLGNLVESFDDLKISKNGYTSDISYSTS